MRLVALLVVVLGALVAPGAARAAVIPVTTTTDEYGTGATECSLREAIQATNTNVAFGGCPAGSFSADEITLPAGTYGFTRSGTEGAGDPGVNDLDVNGALTIVGQGNPTIDANDIDRIFELAIGVPSRYEG
jgi:CSLREA domain-containing protein